ncbi:MAG: J domain-containing protein [Acidobacteriota bacterium]
MSSHAQARLRIMKSIDSEKGVPTPEAVGELAVILDSSGSPSSRLRSRFLTQTGEGGMRVEITTALGPGTIVSVAGQIETPDGISPILGQYRVCACLLAGIGKYHASLAPHMPSAKAAESESPHNRANSSGSDISDCYEVLQVSRHADVDTIHRIFHVLAHRFHPDNRVTGNEDKFREMVEAHTVLADPERRAAHDVQLAENDRGRLKIFDSIESTQGVQAEVRKRNGILRLLYAKRMTNPREPELHGRDFAEMLGCPAEHLEFSLWFLKENHWLSRADNNRYHITLQGAEAFEAQEQNFAKKQPLPLPAPAEVY